MRFLCFIFLTVSVFNVQGQSSTFATPEWQELKKQIGEDSIVGLGEVGHGFESINQAKSTVAHFLHDGLNFQAISFESSFTESMVSFLNNDSLDDRLKNFLYPFWNTGSVKACLKKFFANETNLAKPLIVGFDIQEDCRFEKLSQYLIAGGLITKNKVRLIECDSILSFYIGKNFSRKNSITNEEYLLLINNYDLIAAELVLQNRDTLRNKLLQRIIQNRKWLCQYLTFSTTAKKMYYRDSLMAENIIWMKNELYADNKLIIWAANTHTSKLTGNNKPKWTGEWLSSVYADKYFSIAFQKGVINDNSLFQNNSFKYFTGPDNKFEMIIYMEKLIKIKPQEWVTPCE